MPWRARAPDLLVLLAIAAYVLLLSALSLANYWHFQYADFDLALADQALWLLSRFQEPFLTVRGLHAFADHAHGILLLVAPLYRLLPRVELLLILQTLAFGLGALPVYCLASRGLSRRWLAAAVALAYLLYPAVHWINLENFHPDGFGTCFLLAALASAAAQRWRAYLVWALLAMSVKEDMAATVLLLGLYVAWRHDRRMGLLTSAIALAWLVSYFQLVFPRVSPGAIYPQRWFGWLGGTWPERMATAATQPVLVWARLATVENARYLWELFAPVGGLALLSPQRLLGAGNLYLNLLSGWPYAHSAHYHYTAAVIPWVFLALIGTLARVERRAVTCGLAALLLAVGVAAGHLTAAPADTSLAKGEGIRKLATITQDSLHDASARVALSLIPPDASVSAFDAYLAHLSGRTAAYLFPNPFRGRYYGVDDRPPLILVDHVLMDTRGTGEADRELFERLRASDAYETVHELDEVVLLKRVGDDPALLEDLRRQYR